MNALIKSSFIFNKIHNATNPKIKGIAFELPLVGLQELTRQYLMLPKEVRNISGIQIMNNISYYAQKSKMIGRNNKIQFKNKFVKQFVKLINLVHHINNENSLKKLDELLNNQDFFKGIIWTIKAEIDNNDNTDEKSLCEQLYILEELIVLLMEHLYSRNYSKNFLFQRITNIQSQHTDQSLAIVKILDSFSKLVSNSSDQTYDCVDMIINKINKSDIAYSFIKSHLLDLKASGVIKNILEVDKESHYSIKFYIYSVDNITVTNFLDQIVNKIQLFCKYLNISIDDNFTLKREGEIFLNGMKSTHTTLKLKYFDQFLSTNQFSNLNLIQKIEINKILESLDYPKNQNDMRHGFMSLWSIIEFLLIDSAEQQNKLEAIINNFEPYMALFYFRKTLKLFFRKLLYDIKIIYKEENENMLRGYLSEKLSSYDIDDTDDLFEMFIIYIFTNTSPNGSNLNKWVDFSCDSVDNNFLISQTIMLSNNIKNQLDQFKSNLKSDITQIYRLRNMLVHSGQNDKLILDNTINRLTYYVQTLINSISYSWIYSPDIVTLRELHELKRFDLKEYQKFLELFQTMRNREAKAINKIVHFSDAMVKMPKNSPLNKT
ncbi:hypothetical protein ACI2JA_10785 [Alkalihalobacillus sp. NPDC078783]